MADGSQTKGLRERLTTGTEDRLGRALTDLFDNSLVSGAISRAATTREKATQAQELAMGALNLPSAADVERLTRRLRSISQRLEGIEDGVHQLGRTLATQSLDARLRAIEEQLGGLSRALSQLREKGGAGGRVAAPGGRVAAPGGRVAAPRGRTAASGGRAAAVPAAPTASAAAKPTAKRKPAAKPGKPVANPKAPAKRTAAPRPAAPGGLGSSG